MTQMQEQQIRDLRMRGVGYKAIASITGLTRDVVRNYCKRQAEAALLLRRMPPRVVVCSP